MDKNNKIKDNQLGINHSTANAKLRKMILFDLLQKFNLTTCFQCGEEIELIEDLSIEHKVPWLHSEDPSNLFFDLNNIAFSHLSCNVAAARRDKSSKHGTVGYYKNHKCRCDLCKNANANYEHQRKYG